MGPSSPARLEVGDVLGTSFAVWAKNLRPFALIALLVYSPVIVTSAIRHESPPAEEAYGDGSMSGEGFVPWTESILSFVLVNLLTGALTFGVVQALRGRAVSTWQCVTIGLRRFLPALGVSLLVVLALGGATFVGVFLFSVLASLLGGFAWMAPLDGPTALAAIAVGVVCALPAISVACALAVAVPVAVIEQPLGLGASLRRSGRLTKGHRNRIFATGLVLVGAVFLLTLGIEFLLPTLGLLGVLLDGVVAALVSMTLLAIWPAVVYQRLRGIQDGVSAEDLAQVFD